MQLVMAGDDGSAAAANAVDWATRFVAEREARLLVVRVAGTGQDAPGDVPVDGVTIVNESHPASGIMVAAHDRDADLIVLGRRGSGGFPSLPIGTTAHHVAAACGRPVVVVPPMEKPVDRPLVERVIVGVDGLPGSQEAAAWAVRNFAEAHFTVVHALDLAPAFAQYGKRHERDVRPGADPGGGADPGPVDPSLLRPWGFLRRLGRRGWAGRVAP